MRKSPHGNEFLCTFSKVQEAGFVNDAIKIDDKSKQIELLTEYGNKYDSWMLHRNLDKMSVPVANPSKSSKGKGNNKLVMQFADQMSTWHEIKHQIDKFYHSINPMLTVLTLGCDGSGKSFTLFGASDFSSRGIIPRFVEYMFSGETNQSVDTNELGSIAQSTSNETVVRPISDKVTHMRIKMYLLHRETVIDLLSPTKQYAHPNHVVYSPTMGAVVLPLESVTAVDTEEALNVVRLGLKTSSVLFANDSSLLLLSGAHMCVSFELFYADSDGSGGSTMRTVQFMEIAGSYFNHNHDSATAAPAVSTNNQNNNDNSTVNTAQTMNNASNYVLDPFCGQSRSRWSVQTLFSGFDHAAGSEDATATGNNTDNKSSTDQSTSNFNNSLLTYILQDTLALQHNSCILIACLKGNRSCFAENAAVLDLVMKMEETFNILHAAPEEEQEEVEEAEEEALNDFGSFDLNQYSLDGADEYNNNNNNIVSSRLNSINNSFDNGVVKLIPLTEEQKSAENVFQLKLSTLSGKLQSEIDSVQELIAVERKVIREINGRLKLYNIMNNSAYKSKKTESNSIATLNPDYILKAEVIQKIEFLLRKTQYFSNYITLFQYVSLCNADETVIDSGNSGNINQNLSLLAEKHQQHNTSVLSALNVYLAQHGLTPQIDPKQAQLFMQRIIDSRVVEVPIEENLDDDTEDPESELFSNAVLDKYNKNNTTTTAGGDNESLTAVSVLSGGSALSGGAKSVQIANNNSHHSGHNSSHNNHNKGSHNDADDRQQALLNDASNLQNYPIVYDSPWSNTVSNSINSNAGHHTAAGTALVHPIPPSMDPYLLYLTPNGATELFTKVPLHRGYTLLRNTVISALDSKTEMGLAAEFRYVEEDEPLDVNDMSIIATKTAITGGSNVAGSSGARKQNIGAAAVPVVPENTRKQSVLSLEHVKPSKPSSVELRTQLQQSEDAQFRNQLNQLVVMEVLLEEVLSERIDATEGGVYNEQRLATILKHSAAAGDTRPATANNSILSPGNSRPMTAADHYSTILSHTDRNHPDNALFSDLFLYGVLTQRFDSVFLIPTQSLLHPKRYGVKQRNIGTPSATIFTVNGTAIQDTEYGDEQSVAHSHSHNHNNADENSGHGSRHVEVELFDGDVLQIGTNRFIQICIPRRPRSSEEDTAMGFNNIINNISNISDLNNNNVTSSNSAVDNIVNVTSNNTNNNTALPTASNSTDNLTTFSGGKNSQNNNTNHNYYSNNIIQSSSQSVKSVRTVMKLTPYEQSVLNNQKQYNALTKYERAVYNTYSHIAKYDLIFNYLRRKKQSAHLAVDREMTAIAKYNSRSKLMKIPHFSPADTELTTFFNSIPLFDTLQMCFSVMKCSAATTMANNMRKHIVFRSVFRPQMATHASKEDDEVHYNDLFSGTNGSSAGNNGESYSITAAITNNTTNNNSHNNSYVTYPSSPGASTVTKPPNSHNNNISNNNNNISNINSHNNSTTNTIAHGYHHSSSSGSSVGGAKHVSYKELLSILCYEKTHETQANDYGHLNNNNNINSNGNINSNNGDNTPQQPFIPDCTATASSGASFWWKPAILSERLPCMYDMYDDFTNDDVCHRDLSTLAQHYPDVVDPYCPAVLSNELIGVAFLYIDRMEYLLDHQDAVRIVSFTGDTAGYVNLSVRCWIDKVEPQPSYITADLECNLAQFMGRKLIINFYFEYISGLPLNHCGDVYIFFKFMRHLSTYKTPKHDGCSTQSYLDHTVQIRETITPDLIDYIKTCCLEFEVFGCKKPSVKYPFSYLRENTSNLYNKINSSNSNSSENKIELCTNNVTCSMVVGEKPEVTTDVVEKDVEAPVQQVDYKTKNELLQQEMKHMNTQLNNKTKLLTKAAKLSQRLAADKKETEERLTALQSETEQNIQQLKREKDEMKKSLLAREKELSALKQAAEEAANAANNSYSAGSRKNSKKGSRQSSMRDLMVTNKESTVCTVM